MGFVAMLSMIVAYLRCRYTTRILGGDTPRWSLKPWKNYALSDFFLSDSCFQYKIMEFSIISANTGDHSDVSPLKIPGWAYANMIPQNVLIMEIRHIPKVWSNKRIGIWVWENVVTVYPKKYAHDFCFAVLCCGYTLTDFPISIRLTSLALWQSLDCHSASEATLMNMDKYFMWIHYERLHNHNKAKHNKTVCICLGIYCTYLNISKCNTLKNWKYATLIHYRRFTDSHLYTTGT